MKVTHQILQSDAAIQASLDAGEAVVDAHHTQKLICADDVTWQELVAKYVVFLEGVFGYELLSQVAFIAPEPANEPLFFLIEDEL